MFIALAQPRWAAARGPGALEGRGSRHGVRCLERAGQTPAECPSRRSVTLWNSDALVASLNLPVSQSISSLLTPRAAAARGAWRFAARSARRFCVRL